MRWQDEPEAMRARLTGNGARQAVAASIGFLADILAPIASFTGFPQLAELAETHAAAVAQARARAAAKTYDEATTAVTDIIERLIADHTDTAGS